MLILISTFIVEIARPLFLTENKVKMKIKTMSQGSKRQQVKEKHSYISFPVAYLIYPSTLIYPAQTYAKVSTLLYAPHSLVSLKYGRQTWGNSMKNKYLWNFLIISLRAALREGT